MITWTNLAGTIVGASFELLNTGSFTIAIIITVVYAPGQRCAIVVKTLVPIGVFCDVLK